MAVAVLGVGGGAWRIVPVAVTTLRVVLLGNVLGEIWRNHFANLPRLLLVYVLCAVSVCMASALREALMVVAVHQSSVMVG
jgi:hypothetical protein